MAKTPAPLESLSYEAALSELENILTQLEAGAHDLQRTMGLFERGRALIGRCQQLLDEAQLKVSQLKENGQISNWKGAD